jgi:hypothetical protein
MVDHSKSAMASIISSFAIGMMLAARQKPTQPNPGEAKPATKKKLAALRPPRKKVDKVLAAFTFVLTSDLMPKELAGFAKQDTRIELMETRRQKVEYAG